MKKQADMAAYPWRPWVTDAGYFIYWNWLPESFSNCWSYENSEAQRQGNESITMPIGSPERNDKLRRFQQLVCEDLGVIPLFTQFDTHAMRERVSDFIYYPDKVIVMSKLSLG